MTLIKLRSKNSEQERLTVNRDGNGAILGASVITEGPALGHGFDIDELTVTQVTAALNGLPGRWTHGGLCADGLAQHLGNWENAREDVFLDEDGEPVSRTIADFVFSESAHSIQPDGLNVSAPEYLMQRAEEDPSSFGVSIVGNLSLEDVELCECEDAEPEMHTVARLENPKDLKRGDFVADPAANPTGLSIFAGTPSELAEQGTFLLTRIVEKFGEEKVLEFLGQALSPIGDLQGQIVGLSTELATSRLEVVRLKNEAQTSKDEAFSSYVEGLATQATENQHPIAAKDLDEIRELYALGQEKVARTLGDALLRASTVVAEAEFSNSKTSRLEAENDDHKNSVKNQAAIMSSAGYTVAISEDGNSFTAERKGK